MGVPAPLIALDPVEPDLDVDQIDARLALGWFPYGQRWMTCRVWPTEAGPPHDTVWIRVELTPRPPGDRLRRLAREGCTLEWCSSPRFDAEHQALYERFRAELHPDWHTDVVWALLLDGTQSPGPLFVNTREVAVRDADGRLIAFRWLVQGRNAIAGVVCIYDPHRSGLGTVARGLADRWACDNGIAWSYPGYVRPGYDDPWFYKVKSGRTEWLDVDTGRWRAWVADGPAVTQLSLAEMRARLAERGLVQSYRWWEVGCFDPGSSEFPLPYYVAGPRSDRLLTATVWDVYAKRYEEIVVKEIEDVPWQSRLEVVVTPPYTSPGPLLRPTRAP